MRPLPQHVREVLDRLRVVRCVLVRMVDRRERRWGRMELASVDLGAREAEARLIGVALEEGEVREAQLPKGATMRGEGRRRARLRGGR
jgi:hypothetical protein